jgi:hypothetical protein
MDDQRSLDCELQPNKTMRMPVQEIHCLGMQSRADGRDAMPGSGACNQCSRAPMPLSSLMLCRPPAQFIYKAYMPDGTMTLQHFIILFGALQLILSQAPNIHSLSGLNLFSTFATLAFAIVATAMSIDCGLQLDRTTVSYELPPGDINVIIMTIFAALGTVGFG